MVWYFKRFERFCPCRWPYILLLFRPATWPNLPQNDTATVEFSLVNLLGMTNKDLCRVQSVQGSFPLFYCLVWNTNNWLSLQAAMSPFDLRAERIALKRLGVGALFCSVVPAVGALFYLGAGCQKWKPLDIFSTPPNRC